MSYSDDHLWGPSVPRGIVDIKNNPTATDYAIKQDIEAVKFQVAYRDLERKFEELQQQHNFTLNIIKIHYPELLL